MNNSFENWPLSWWPILFHDCWCSFISNFISSFLNWIIIELKLNLSKVFCNFSIENRIEPKPIRFDSPVSHLENHNQEFYLRFCGFLLFNSAYWWGSDSLVTHAQLTKQILRTCKKVQTSLLWAFKTLKLILILLPPDYFCFIVCRVLIDDFPCVAGFEESRGYVEVWGTIFSRESTCGSKSRHACFPLPFYIYLRRPRGHGKVLVGSWILYTTPSLNLRHCAGLFLFP